MQEISIHSHCYVKEVHEEYHIRWTGKIDAIEPKFKNNQLVFVIVGGAGRMELNTNDMTRIERCAKLCTQPKGRAAITSDVAYIYIVNKDDTERLIGTLTHNHVKEYGQVNDKVYYRED